MCNTAYLCEYADRWYFIFWKAPMLIFHQSWNKLYFHNSICQTLLVSMFYLPDAHLSGLKACGRKNSSNPAVFSKSIVPYIYIYIHLHTFISNYVLIHHIFIIFRKGQKYNPNHRNLGILLKVVNKIIRICRDRNLLKEYYIVRRHADLRIVLLRSCGKF